MNRLTRILDWVGHFMMVFLIIMGLLGIIILICVALLWLLMHYEVLK